MTGSDLSGLAPDLAPRLLGCLLTHDSAAGTVTVRLTEVEAYAGTADPASHAYRGPTRRTAVMFGPPGRLYVYRSYGLHWAMNVVVGPPGTASAVLLRAGAVIEGESLALARRAPTVARLATGPGNLSQALGITGADDGTDLLGDGHLRLRPGPAPATAIRSGPRVGVSVAAEVPWRFWLDGDPTVSAYRRSKRAGQPGPWARRSWPGSGSSAPGAAGTEGGPDGAGCALY